MRWCGVRRGARGLPRFRQYRSDPGQRDDFLVRLADRGSGSRRGLSCTDRERRRIDHYGSRCGRGGARYPADDCVDATDADRDPREDLADSGAGAVAYGDGLQWWWVLGRAARAAPRRTGWLLGGVITLLALRSRDPRRGARSRIRAWRRRP